MVCQTGELRLFSLANRKEVSLLTTGAKQKLAARCRYGPWRNTMTQAEKSGVDNPYRYSTKEWDENSGLYYFGFRYYSPEIGRWTQRDPAGTADGLNLYVYTGGDPVGALDPWGIEKKGCYLEKKGKYNASTGRCKLAGKPPKSSSLVIAGGLVLPGAGAGVYGLGATVGSAAISGTGAALIVVGAGCAVYDIYALVANVSYYAGAGWAANLETIVAASLPNPERPGEKLPRGGDLLPNQAWTRAKYSCMPNDDLIVDIWRDRGKWTYFERWICPCSRICKEEVVEWDKMR